jgi:hypothetical protein
MLDGHRGNPPAPLPRAEAAPFCSSMFRSAFPPPHRHPYGNASATGVGAGLAWPGHMRVDYCVGPHNRRLTGIGLAVVLYTKLALEPVPTAVG